MNEEQIITFHQVRDFLNTVPNINRGGCGISAFAMYLWLKKNNQLKPEDKLVYMYNMDSDRYEMNTRFVETMSGEIRSCSHACILHGGLYLDSNGIVSIGNFNLIQHIPFTKIGFLIESIKEDDWNYAFDRSYIKTIESALEIDMPCL